MSTSNKVGFVLLVLIIGAALSLCAPPANIPAPEPGPSGTPSISFTSAR